MTETTRQIQPIRPPVLDLEDLQDRYDIGKTKCTELVASDDFPRSVVPGMHRYPLAAIEAWELRYSLHGTVAEPQAPTSTTVINAPAAARAGRPPARKREAA